MRGRFLSSCVALVLLSLVSLAPGAAAQLSVTVDTSYGYDLYVEGATSFSAPFNFTARPQGDDVLLSWDAPNAGPVSSYTIYRAPGPGNEDRVWSVRVPPTWTTATDYWADEDERYFYFVTANYGGSGGTGPAESIPSEVDTPWDEFPRCGVVSVYTRPPYIDVHISCLVPPT